MKAKFRRFYDHSCNAKKEQIWKAAFIYATSFNSRCKRKVHTLFSKYVAKER